MMRKVFLTLLFALGLPGPVFAGFVLRMETTHPEESKGGREQSVMYIDEGRVRIDEEIESGQAPKGAMIYREDRNVVWAIDHDNHEVQEITRESMGKVAQQLREMMKRIEEQMAALPPDQRAMLEKHREMMGEGGAPLPGGGGGKRPPLEIRRTSEEETHQGYPCVKYEGWRGGKKVEEYWVTNWDRIGADRHSFDALTSLGRFMQEVTAPLGAGPSGESFTELDKIGGFPVVTREFKNGRVVAETVLQSVVKRDIDAKTFEPPAGYKRRPLGPAR